MVYPGSFICKMSSEIHGLSQERNYRGVDNVSLKKRALCSPDTLKLDKSNFPAIIYHGDMMRRFPSYTAYDGIQQSDVPKSTEKISHENLERLYICKVDESKLSNGLKIYSEEQPLDFSRKPIFSVRKDENPQKSKKSSLDSPITSQGSQEDSANSSDSVDDSFDEEEKPECFPVHLYTNGARTPREAFYKNGFENTAYGEREVKPLKMYNRMHLKNNRMNEYKKNGVKCANTSGSEDESHFEYSVHNGVSYKQNGNHSPSKSLYTANFSAEGKVSPFSQYAGSEIPHESNHHPENGSNISREKNDRFHIQDILSHDNQSTPNATNNETGHQNNTATIQQSINPQVRFNHFVKEDNLASRSTSPQQAVNIPPGSTSPSHSMRHSPGHTSPSHSMHLSPSRFPLGSTDRLHESNGMIPPYIQRVVPPNQFSNFMNHNPQVEASVYSRLYSYPLGAMVQPPFNPMFGQPYQPALLGAQDPQRQKKQRPFKNIDPSVLMQHVPIIQTAVALNIGSSPSTYNSTTTTTTKTDQCNASTTMDSPPQRLSPDSQCIVNGSSGNDSLAQDTNDENGRKKIRRIPPEEKDEKYLEKRRKNNLAAKKSRDERRRKEDVLALSCQELLECKLKLEAENKFLSNNLTEKIQRLELILISLISFREKCEGHTKEMFEEVFKSFLPQ